MTKSGLELLNELIAELEESLKNANGRTPNNNNPTTQINRPAQKEGKGASTVVKAASTATPPVAPKGVAKAASTPPVAKGELTLNSLDLRVGKIVEVKRHETAEKLYCEMIDVGEAEPRPIASGLVPHYSLEQMQGRNLIVVANLKARNLVGFKSYGMVLCAAKVDPDTGVEKVEFIDPPAGSKVGSRVVIVTGEEIQPPLSSSQVEKQKAFEILAADLRVGDDGVAKWRGCPLEVVGEGTCTAPTLKDAQIR